MKLLIVDDEIRLCRLIDHLIDWEELKLTSVGFCHDGIEALEIIEEKCPDIVITDIRMPNCNGLELIETLKKKYASMYIIVISGHSDFVYAQSAIKFGVEDYLLKPIRKIELQSALEKIIKDYSGKKIEAEERTVLRNKLDMGSKIIRSNFLEKLMLYPDSIDFTMKVESINQNYGCDFKNGYYQMAVIHFLSPSDLDREKMIQFFNEKVFSNSQVLYKGYNEMLTFQNQYLYAFLINNGEEGYENMAKGMRKIRTTLRSYSQFLENARIYFYISDVVKDIQELGRLPEQIKMAGYQRFFHSPLSIIEVPNYEEFQIKEYLPGNFMEDFAKFMEAFSIEGLKKQSTELIVHLQELNIKKGYIIKAIYDELLNLAVYVLKSNGISGYENMLQNLHSAFENSNDYKELLHCFYSQINVFLSDILSHQHMENGKPIREAKQYINSHYVEQLTLEVVGDVVGLSPTYLSSVFKRETGVSFVDYVTDVRIANAKKLLVTSDQPLIDIAGSTGFHDMKYFSKIFKKIVGLSPSEYRKLYS